MARSIKKGPFIEGKLFKRVMMQSDSVNKRPIKTYSRASVIIPEMVGATIQVYNGKVFVPVLVTENLVGHKLGEFSPTRSFRGHAGSDKKGRK